LHLYRTLIMVIYF